MSDQEQLLQAQRIQIIAKKNNSKFIGLIMNNSVKTKVIIISLEKSVDRRNSISESINALPQKIDYEFFNAVYGKENPNHPLFEKYNGLKRQNRKGNQLNLSQLGCLASHYLLWEKSVLENNAFIILEDDAILQDNFIEVYNFTYSNENRFEFFYLSQNNAKNQKSKLRYQFPNSDTKVSRFFGGWGNTTGYFITPKAAQKLLNVTKEWLYESDITIDRYWESGIDYLGITPPVVKPGDFNSDIPIDKEKKTIVMKIKREFYKLIDNINKFKFDLLN